MVCFIYIFEGDIAGVDLNDWLWCRFLCDSRPIPWFLIRFRSYEVRARVNFGNFIVRLDRGRTGFSIDPWFNLCTLRKIFELCFKISLIISFENALLVQAINRHVNWLKSLVLIERLYRFDHILLRSHNILNTLSWIDYLEVELFKTLLLSLRLHFGFILCLERIEKILIAQPAYSGSIILLVKLFDVVLNFCSVESNGSKGLWAQSFIDRLLLWMLLHLIYLARSELPISRLSDVVLSIDTFNGGHELVLIRIVVVYQSLHVFLDRIHSLFVAVLLQLSELLDVILEQVLI